MSRRLGIILAAVLAIVLVVGAILFWFAPDNPELSGDVNEGVERLAAESGDAPEIESAVTATSETMTAEAEAAVETDEPTEMATDEATEVVVEDDSEASAESVVFSIDSEQSQVEFNIDEVLRGEDVTVVGVTNQVAGDILVNFADPAASEVGEILINARALETDASGRNRAMRNFILLSQQDEYEFIRFQPTGIENMPETVNVGDEIAFQVVGDLTIIDTTQPVTFDVTLTATSETELAGTGETTVLYEDFDISIPSVPFVASVEDDILLKIDFVATAEGAA